MEFLDILTPFVGTETPFAFLFMTLFFYFIKTSKDREQKHLEIIKEDLRQQNKDLKILIEVWKILLEKELEGKKNGTDKPN